MPRAHKRELLRTVEELREMVLVLHEAFADVCESEGVRSTMRGNWQRLFEQMDEDGSGRLSFKEFQLASKLLVRERLDFSSLSALWAYIDEDGSGELTIKEFQRATYMLILDGWEDLLVKERLEELKQIVADLNEAVETRHTRKRFHDTHGGGAKETRGNWFKVFQMIDVDGSGILGYEELEEVIRADYPGLGMKPAQLSQARIRGLWKAIDSDRSGDVTVDEFMGFMRKHGPAGLTRLTSYSMMKRGLSARTLAEQREEAARARAARAAARKPWEKPTGGVESWATDSWCPSLRAASAASVKGPDADWVLPRVGAACRADIPPLSLDADDLPPHLTWIGKSATLNSLPSPRARLNTAKSDAHLECNSIALGSVQALQRSRVPHWPPTNEPPLRIGRKKYDLDTRPVHVALQLVHSPVTRGRPKSLSFDAAIPPSGRPRTAPPKKEPSARAVLMANLGFELETDAAVY